MRCSPITPPNEPNPRENNHALKPLTSRSRVTDLLTRHGLRAEKGLGQNFLVDSAALRAIVEAAQISPGDSVLEVGPGLGVLTLELALAGANVTSVELDERLRPVLEETLAPLESVESAGTVEVIYEDALAFDLSRVPRGSKLVANLPYYVATPVIARALESGRFSHLLFLVQREVGERLTAAPGSSAYGALSLLVAHYGSARMVRTVPPGAFMPAPKVTSAVVLIRTRPGAAPHEELFELIQQAFAHRRKTLRKNLEYVGYDREAVNAALLELGLSGSVRGEELGLPEFERLLHALKQNGFSR